MGSLRGVVESATDGQPIPEARVLVVSGPSHPDIAALTNENGRFRLGGLEPGRYVIEVYAEGYVSARGRVRVLQRGARIYRIALEQKLPGDEDGESIPEIN